MNIFTKRIGNLELTMWEPSPRRLEIRSVTNDYKLVVDIEDAKDLAYAIGRIVEQAERADAEWAQRNKPVT